MLKLNTETKSTLSQKQNLPLKGVNYSIKLFALFGYCFSLRKVTVDVHSLKSWNIVVSRMNQQRVILSTNVSATRSFLIQGKFYKGVRYVKNLPVRGQRTHTNAQTVRTIAH